MSRRGCSYVRSPVCMLWCSHNTLSAQFGQQAPPVLSSACTLSSERSGAVSAALFFGDPLCCVTFNQALPIGAIIPELHIKGSSLLGQPWASIFSSGSGIFQAWGFLADGHRMASQPHQKVALASSDVQRSSTHLVSTAHRSSGTVRFRVSGHAALCCRATAPARPPTINGLGICGLNIAYVQDTCRSTYIITLRGLVVALKISHKLQSGSSFVDNVFEVADTQSYCYLCSR
jgi:hypothetical protein